jgi:tripeptide aminopeptidase
MTDHLPSVAQRFLRYVQIDTQSDPDSESVPSTEKQKDLARLLVEELQAIGIGDAEMDEYGYVFGTLPAVGDAPDGNARPVLGLLAHLDTSPDAPGANVRPIVHAGYDGGIIVLPGDPSVQLNPATQPALLDHIGHDLITSDGTTLLGSDDKAGVAILMQLAENLIADSTTPRPTIRLCFTIDEEIGRGVDHLDLNRLGADIAYTIDGSGVGNVFTETFNAALATVTVEGVMVHPGYARGIMVNAVRILSELIAALPSHEAPENTDDRVGYIHPHDISAGDAARARVRFILRDFSEGGLQTKKEFLTSLVEFHRVKYPGARITLDLKDQYKNMRSYIENTDPRVVSLAFRAAEQMGIRLEEHVIRGGTDGARLSELGIPTPNIFNGGHDYHSRFEWNSVQNLETSLTYLTHLVHAWGFEK